jgi:hypothetical protein
LFTKQTRHAHCVPRDSFQLQQLRAERDYLKEELFFLKNQKEPPKEISTAELTELVMDGKTPLHLILNPYIPFNILSKLLGYSWMSGCFGGLSIVLASGIFGLQFLSLFFLCLMVACVMIVVFMYLDA